MRITAADIALLPGQRQSQRDQPVSDGVVENLGEGHTLVTMNRSLRSQTLGSV